MRRPSLATRLFIREPRGAVADWDVASAARWVARAGVPRAAARRVLAGKTGTQLLALTYAAVAAAAATPAEADAVWAALGDLKARAAHPVGSPTRARRSPSPVRVRAAVAPAPPPPPSPPPHASLTADDLCGVEPAALASALAAWAGFGAPRTLAEAAAGGGRRLLGRGLDGRAWAKLCRDCGLLVPPALDAAGADIIFARVAAETAGGGVTGRPAAAPAARRAWACGGAPATVASTPPPPRRLDFPAALSALRAVAAESGRPLGYVLRSVVAGDPVLDAGCTVPDAFVRWHDDKGTFTGTAARGGPAVRDGAPGRAGAAPGCGAVDAASLVDRSMPADVRGTPVPTAAALRKALAAAELGGGGGGGGNSTSPRRRRPAAAGTPTPPGAAGTPTAGALPRFVVATPFSAAASSRSGGGWEAEVEEEEESGHTRGRRHHAPPSPSPPPPPPHLRGRAGPPSPPPLTAGPDEEAALRSVFASFALFGAGGGGGSASRSGPPSPVKGGGGGGAPAAFNVRASWDCGLGGALTPTAGGGPAMPHHPLPALDGARWAKLVREAGLLGGGGGLDAAAADLIFARARVGGSSTAGRRLSYGRFKAALRLVAAAKHVPPSAVVRAVLATGGPALHGATVPEPVRWHDDLSTYTGTAARGGPDVGSAHVDLAALTDRARPWRRGGEV
jgi:hypothetical protein